MTWWSGVCNVDWQAGVSDVVVRCWVDWQAGVSDVVVRCV